MSQSQSQSQSRVELQCAHCPYRTSITLEREQGHEFTPTDHEHLSVQEWDYEMHLFTGHRVQRPNQLDVPERNLING